MIEISIKATNGGHLRKQLLDLLGLYDNVNVTMPMPDRPGAGDFDALHPDKGDFGTLPSEPGDVITAPGEYELAPQGKPVEAPKARRGRPRTKPVEAPVAAPVAAPEPETDPLEEAIDALTNQVDAESLEPDEDAGYTIDVGSVGNAVDNEMLKREVIASLSDMFTAGQVKTVRHVLHKYGRGAKSFPEIDAAHFPEIKAALERNEAA